jgi:hypothetical protein
MLAPDVTTQDANEKKHKLLTQDVQTQDVNKVNYLPSFLLPQAKRTD